RAEGRPAGPQPAEGGSVLQVAAGPEAPSDGGAAGRGPGGGGSRQRARPVAEGPGPGSRGRLAAGGRGAQVGSPLGRLRLAGAVGSSRALSPSPSSPALRVHRLTSSRSLIDLTSDSAWDQQKPPLFPKSCLRPKSASSPWIPSITIPQPFKMTLREARKKSQLMKSYLFLELDKPRDKRQSQDEAECQKQFRAQPVPAHVFLPLYHEIMEQNEIRRQIATQKRKELLLSTQRPFSFLEKEEKKKEAIRQKFLAAATSSESSKPKQASRKVPKSTYDPLLGDKLKEAELYREIRIQMRAKDLLESSVAPIDTSNCRRKPQSRTATKTKQEKLGFLQDNSFSFTPRINPTIPDFEELYWAFQREAVRRQEVKEATRNKPFKLRTSNLRSRQKQANERIKDSHQLSKVSMQKSRSLTALSSLSSNTLPVHITDATRKRESAIRCSQESKKEGDKEGIYWLEEQKKKCQAIRKSVNSRAKALDPHRSLDETLKEKLKQNWSVSSSAQR
uniref:FAM161 centrosomal protein B n=1 Tax=Anas platyrhynchos TaxID=8839 RepID=A0A8B9TCA9_ANAPL